MLKIFVAAVVGIAGGRLNAHAAEKPTVVLVHGAVADASSWNGVSTRLEKDGYPVVAVANQL
ncbi:alpha/beta hydrolase, partial [Rhizobium ruizarguesonis]